MNNYNAFLINIINEIEVEFVSLKKSVSNIVHGACFIILIIFLLPVSASPKVIWLSFIVNLKKIKSTLSIWTNFEFVLGQFLFVKILILFLA